MLYEKGFVTPNKTYLVGQPLFIPGIAMDMNYTPQKMVDSMLQRTPKVQSPYPGAGFVDDPYSNAAFNPSLPENSVLYPPLPQDIPPFHGPPSAFGLPVPGFYMNCYPNIPSPVLLYNDIQLQGYIPMDHSKRYFPTEYQSPYTNTTPMC